MLASEQSVVDVDTSRRTAQQQVMQVERHGSDVVTISWHRNWIVRLSNELA